MKLPHYRCPDCRNTVAIKTEAKPKTIVRKCGLCKEPKVFVSVERTE